MNQKSILIVSIVIILALLLFVQTDKNKTSSPNEPTTLNDEPLMINALQYHENMRNAQTAKIILSVPFGTEQNQLGGFLQDTEHYTEGMPWTFRVNADSTIWILDSINQKLKLFDISTQTMIRSISLVNFGVNIMDFAIYKDTEGDIFAFFNHISGEIFFTNNSGELINKLQGFTTASSIEFANNKDLLVSLPIAKGKVRLALDGQLQGIYLSDETLSLIEANSGGFYGLSFDDKQAKLWLREDYPASSIKNLASFEYELTHQQDVWFAGGEVYGTDANNNIYLGLVVCDIRGVIYRERLYKCDPTGKVLASTDIISNPVLSASIPRKRVVSPDGKVYSAYYDPENYIISTHQFNN